MVWLYGGLLILAAAGLIYAGKKERQPFGKLDRKEHPLKVFYPAVSALLARFNRKNKGNKYVEELLKVKLVKENVKDEAELYRIRKAASAMAVLMGGLALGFLVSLSEMGIDYIKTIERNPFGQGSREYELEAEYRGSQEEVRLTLDEVHLSRSEIAELFENSIEEVKTEMLGDNESQDKVTQSLNLINEWKGISILWNIEDVSAVNYNGDIKAELEEGESLLVSLSAVFTLDDMSETYIIPVNLVGRELSDQEKLLEAIRKAIQENSGPQDVKVTLPTEVKGHRIRFFQEKSSNAPIFLMLSIIASVVIFILYDRKLKEDVEKQRDEMLMDYSEIVSKLSLLYEAGVSLRGAFERILEDEKRKDERRHVYQEIELMLEKIKSGISEAEAYAQFGRRCGIHQYLKLGNILEQNLNKGAKGMRQLLNEEVRDSFEERKRLARKKGEEASTKMLLPMVMMLMIVIAIIAIPALMSMNV